MIERRISGFAVSNARRNGFEEGWRVGGDDHQILFFGGTRGGHEHGEAGKSQHLQRRKNDEPKLKHFASPRPAPALSGKKPAVPPFCRRPGGLIPPSADDLLFYEDGGVVNPDRLPFTVAIGPHRLHFGGVARFPRLAVAGDSPITRVPATDQGGYRCQLILSPYGAAYSSEVDDGESCSLAVSSQNLSR